LEAGSHYLERIRKRIDEAAETDYVMPVWLPFLPLTIFLLILFVLFPLRVASYWMDSMGHHGFLRLFVFTSVLFAVLSIAGVVLGLYILYKLIKRRNDHLRRARRLWEAVTSFLEAKGFTGERSYRLKELVDEMKDEEWERSPVLWIILTLLFPPVVFYIYHFLNKDFRRHEAQEARYYSILVTVLSGRVSVSRMPEFERAVPERSTVLYLVLTLLTLGLFSLYWVYTLADDPNRHFMQHKRLERELLSVLEHL